MVDLLYKINTNFNELFKSSIGEKWFVDTIISYYNKLPKIKSGINKNKNRKEKIIVSLTTMPSRIETVAFAIESIMRQTYRPDRILLWLASDEFPSKNILPQRLLNLRKRGLEIHFCENLRPYNKLYYSLKKFPEDIIITIDDDVIYSEKLIEQLMRGHKKFTNCIICTRAHEIKIDYMGNVWPYNSWLLYEQREKFDTLPSMKNFFTGVGGVLYPPHCLDDMVFDAEIIRKMVPLADDIWFNLMARKKGTKTALVKTNSKYLFVIPESQRVALHMQNCGHQRNDIYLKNVMNFLGFSGFDLIGEAIY